MPALFNKFSLTGSFRIMTKIIPLIVFYSLFVLGTQAQITVDDSQSINTLVKSLEGPGVKISNISYHLSSNSSPGPAGYFTDPFGAIGLDRGLLLTTGAAIYAIGPNDVSDKSKDNGDSLQDPDLYSYVNDKMYDVCYVEFDFITSHSSLSFNYVFGSEEYVEYLDYHDQFAFLISGPGISGKQNIALVPNTNTPVSVFNIDPQNNSQYFISNGTGSTPYINLDVQYDGYTQVLKAKSPVIPCQTYHIKLIIADLKDGRLDSGVFIEQESFVSKDIDLKVIYEHPRYSPAIEGCNKAYIVFKRSATSAIPLSSSLTMNYFIKGTATNGIDYATIQNSIVIPANQDTAYVTIDAFADGIPDDAEFVRLVLKSPCPSFPVIDSIDVIIKEALPYPIPSDKICQGQTVMLNKSFIHGDSIIWDASPYLSCDTCLSPIASNPSSAYFEFLAKDSVSGCKTRDSVFVEVLNLKADLSFSQDPCYSTLDFFFKDHSTNAAFYNWSFGDNTSSNEQNPLHQFPFLNNQDPVQYTVTLEVSREDPGCSADTSIVISISNPLFIPNLVTADQNGKNDNFEILGIGSDCWQLNIYNIWNSLVYRNDNYKNNFNGEKLPEGVYYFHLQNHPTDRRFKGWIHIIK
jgi:hypothetical protein